MRCDRGHLAANSDNRHDATHLRFLAGRLGTCVRVLFHPDPTEVRTNENDVCVGIDQVRSKILVTKTQL